MLEKKRKTLNPLLAKFKKGRSVKRMAENVLTVEEVATKYFKAVTKAHIEKYAKQMRSSEVDSFNDLFKSIKGGLRLNGRVYQGVDKGGNPYRYYKFFSPKGDVECKLFPLGKIYDMIADYQLGKFSINFKAADLIEHLLNR